MKNIILLLFLIISNAIFSQTIVYETLIADNFDYTIDDGVEDAQHNTVFVGMKGNFSLVDTVYFSVYIMKLNPSGQVIGYKEIVALSPIVQLNHSASTIGSPSILYLSNNQYLVAASKLEPDNLHSQLVFLRLDVNFNVLQTYEYGEIGQYDYLMNILQDKQGNFLVGSFSQCGVDRLDTKTTITKFDTQFNPLDSVQMPICGRFYTQRHAFSKMGLLEKTNNKGYYVLRSMQGTQEIFNLSSNLQIQGADNQNINSSAASFPNICASWIDKEKQVVVGSQGGTGFPIKQDIRYYIRDTLGNILYQDSIYYSATEEIAATGAIANRLNHDFYLGFTKDFDGIFDISSFSKFVLLKIDEFGNKKWRATYGDSAGQYVMYKTLATYDGGIIMAGTKIMDNRPAVDTVRRGLYIVKVMDNSLKIDAPTLSASMYKLYPNPSDNTLNISLSENIQAKVELLDLQGKVLFSKDFVKQCEIEVQDFCQGLYFYRIIDAQNRSAAGKWEKR